MDRKPHLCVLTSAHPTDDVRVYSKIANSFLEEGWLVSWVGPKISTHNASRLDNRISYHYTPAIRNRLDRMKSPWLLPRASKEVHDVDWWYSPDPDAAYVATRLARKRGGRAVFDIHEVFHEGHLARWTFGRQVGWLSSLVKSRIRATCKRANLVLGVGTGVLERYTNGLKTPALVVRNCAPASFASAGTSHRETARETVILHGKAIQGNGTPSVLVALREFVDPGFPLRVIMINDPEHPVFPPEAFESQVANVTIQTILPLEHKDMPSLTASCGVGMIAYQRDLGVDSMPNRLFEYMAAGIAIFAPYYSVELTQILDDEKIGITADFESPKSIAAGLEWLVDHPDEVREMGVRAKNAFLQRHCWEAEFGRLVVEMEKQS